MKLQREFSKVVGANVRDLRTGSEVTMEQLARTGQRLGYNWSLSRIAAIERGRTAPSVVVLLQLAHGLGVATGKPVTLADLCASEGYLRFNDTYAVRGAVVTAALQGQPVNPQPQDFAGHNPSGGVEAEGELSLTEQVRQYGFADAQAAQEALGCTSSELVQTLGAAAAFGQTEKRAVAELDVDPLVAARVMVRLWGKLLSEKRDALTPTGAKQQAVASISRQLRRELADQLAEMTTRQRHPNAPAEGSASERETV